LRFPQANVPIFALRHAERLADKAAINDWPTGQTGRSAPTPTACVWMDLHVTAEAVRFCDELHARLRDTYEGPA
jgi:hypothetical protein